MKILYFTATGNCLCAAKRVGGELFSIPKILKEKKLVFEDDKIGIIFPCYCLGAPAFMSEFLSKVKLKSDYIFAIMTFGNFAGAGINHFVDIAERNGIKIAYSNELLMIDNYLPFFDMDEQIKNEKSKKIEENLDKIIADINAKKRKILQKNFGMKIATFIAQKSYNIALGKRAKNYIVQDNCTGCKVCEKVCAFDNIKVDKKPVFGDKCEFCLACINLCPTNSIKLKKEKSSARFRNKNVSLNEIISAND